MTPDERATRIREWVRAANRFDSSAYLSFFARDAVVNDPSVGRSFEGVNEIAEYFDAYFMGYETHTEIEEIEARGIVDHVEVVFTGTFPEGVVRGVFDVTFEGDTISRVNANLA